MNKEGITLRRLVASEGFPADGRSMGVYILYQPRWLTRERGLMKCDPPMFEYNRQLNQLPDLFLLERRTI